MLTALSAFILSPPKLHTKKDTHSYALKREEAGLRHTRSHLCMHTMLYPKLHGEVLLPLLRFAPFPS